MLVRFPNGRESNVSVRDLAPCPRPVENGNIEINPGNAAEECHPVEDILIEDHSMIDVQQTPAVDHSNNDASLSYNDIIQEPADHVENKEVASPKGSSVTDAETYRVQESGGVNRWISTRSNKGVPPKRYGDVASMISFIVE